MVPFQCYGWQICSQINHSWFMLTRASITLVHDFALFFWIVFAPHLSHTLLLIFFFLSLLKSQCSFKHRIKPCEYWYNFQAFRNCVNGNHGEVANEEVNEQEEKSQQRAEKVEYGKSHRNMMNNNRTGVPSSVSYLSILQR